MRLIILNGPVGIGKTTLAKRLQENMPLSFFIHFDELRRHIGGYREKPHESRVLTFDLVFSIAETCFKQGKDVLIDKIMYDRLEKGKKQTSLTQLIGIAEKYDADIHEFIIWADKETVLSRLEERGYREGGLLTPEKAEKFWEEMKKFKDSRPQATIVDTSNLTPEQVFEEVGGMISK